jgi:PleD family two-component response regulator
MRMLVVDDVMTNCIVIKRTAMKVFGGEIDIETSPLAAIKACHEKKYDIIVVDYYMPDMNGIEFVNVLRNFDEYRLVPIIMATSCRDNAIYNKSIRCGIDDFILKPLDFNQFRSKISFLLSNKARNFAA